MARTSATSALVRDLHYPNGHRETIEEFLRRGGQITRCAPRVSRDRTDEDRLLSALLDPRLAQDSDRTDVYLTDEARGAQRDAQQLRDADDEPSGVNPYVLD